MTHSSPSSMRRDIASAYLATLAKIGSWVIVLGLVYRYINIAEFALLALVRGTIGILNYTSLGLAPAMIRSLAETRRPPAEDEPGDILAYHSAEPDRQVQSLYANGLIIALICGLVGLILTFAYSLVFQRIYHMPMRMERTAFWVVFWIGCGTVLRLMSDAPGSLLQASHLIAKDNFRVVEAEAAWVILSVYFPFTASQNRDTQLHTVAFFYTVSGLILFLRRSNYARQLTHPWLPQWRLIDEATLKRLLGFGSLVLFAQLADYLYAPTDYILINLFIGWDAVAVYTPAMTIDAGLLLLVGGLSSVILPRAALADTAGDHDRVRRYYIYGTLASVFLLLVAAAIIWLLSGWIFKLWLGNPMPATQAILPLVLIHTVVGGSSGVGRSVLLGMGKVKPFTISVLIAGVANVLLSYIFVRHLHLGLKGIIYGTIIVVVARCALWMPWYIRRTLASSR